MRIPKPNELPKTTVSNDTMPLPIDSADVQSTVQKINLPIDSRELEIVSALDESQAVVVSAETGAGKSTRVPRMLMDAGYDVIVTQPRRLAVMSVADRVGEELETDGLPSSRVGWRTARDSQTSQENQILFCTDGLQLVRELHGTKGASDKKRVLVLDEVHEWNTNIEVLVAWAKKQIQENPNFKVVCMSATLATKELAEFLGADVPVVDVEGRTFSVEKKIGSRVVEDTVALARQGKNVLVFLPGKAEIDGVEAELLRCNLNNTILPLHGELDKNEQKKVFDHYPGGKIVLATNVAQTSITIDDIDAVVDSGAERRTEIRQGVEGLYLGEISQADCLQRAGRAGRTKKGEYILSSINGSSIKPLDERAPYPVPEIQRTRLDSTIMRLAGAGFDIDELEFFHQPETSEIAIAKDRLIKLGAIDQDGQLTKVGRQMERLPVDSHYARMLVEIQKHNNPRLTYMMMELIAIQQAGGIVKSGKYNQSWRTLLEGNYDSDLLAELAIFQELPPRTKWKDYDLLGRNINETKQILKLLKKSIKVDFKENGMPNNEEAVLLQKAIVAGLIDQVWVSQYGGDTYSSVFGNQTRERSISSVVSGAKYVVGSPFDLQIQGRRGPITLSLLQGLTAIDSSWLAEIAPQLLSIETSNPRTYFDKNTGELHARGDLMFGSLVVGDEELEPSEDLKLDVYLNCLNTSEHMYSEWYFHLRKELNLLADEVKLFDYRFAEDLWRRFDNLLKFKLRDNGLPRNLYACLADPPQIDIVELFSDTDIQNVEFINEQYTKSIEIAGNNIPVNYRFDYYQNQVVGEMRIDLSVAALLVDNPVICKIPNLKIAMTDGTYSFATVSTFDEAAIVAKRRIEQLVEESMERSNRIEREILDSEAIAQGNPTNFGGETRLGTGSRNIGYWVITPQGEARQPDQNGIWKVLRNGEIAISVNHPENDPMIGIHEVAWQDRELTTEQIAKIREIEERLYMKSGAWALSEQDRSRKRAVVEVVRGHEFLGALLGDIMLDADQIYNQLNSRTGLRIEVDPTDIYEGTIQEDAASEYSADGRKAMLMEDIQITDNQAIQVLAYYKYGGWNVALKLIDKQKVAAEAKNYQSGEISSEDLSALMGKFNKY